MGVEGNVSGLREHGGRDVGFQEGFIKGSNVQSDSVFCFLGRGCCVVGGGVGFSMFVDGHAILVVEINSIEKRLANAEKLICPADNRLCEDVGRAKRFVV